MNIDNYGDPSASLLRVCGSADMQISMPDNIPNQHRLRWRQLASVLRAGRSVKWTSMPDSMLDQHRKNWRPPQAYRGCAGLWICQQVWRGTMPNQHAKSWHHPQAYCGSAGFMYMQTSMPDQHTNTAIHTCVAGVQGCAYAHKYANST